VTEQKAARIRRLAARWLAVHSLRPREVRIDLVGVLVPRRGGPSLEHVRGVG
jgi:putative endonuclease